jgi:hypothetical protein
MLHPVAANLAFSLGKRMGRSNGGHDSSRSVRVGKSNAKCKTKWHFGVRENTEADRQLPRIIFRNYQEDSPLGSRGLPDAPGGAQFQNAPASPRLGFFFGYSVTGTSSLSAPR